jgi:hypothetical protein
MNVVAHNNILPTAEGLIVQNPNTGVVDILGFDGTAHLVSSAMVNTRCRKSSARAFSEIQLPASRP